MKGDSRKKCIKNSSCLYIKEPLKKSEVPAVQGQVFAPAKPAFPASMPVKCRQN